MKSLKNIGTKFGTDKSRHKHGSKTYLDVYEKYLFDFIDSDINLLEIGVKNGQSLRVWKEYFQKAKIFGLDIDPRCKKFEEDRIEILIGSQSDRKLIESFLSTLNNGLDVIIDDGSHINELTIKSFEILFDRLNEGGIYIIEDLGCSYVNNISEQIQRAKWPGMEYNQNVEFSNNRIDIDNLFNNLIHELDKNSKRIEFIHFYSRICIIKKLESIND